MGRGIVENGGENRKKPRKFSPNSTLRVLECMVNTAWTERVARSDEWFSFLAYYFFIIWYPMRGCEDSKLVPPDSQFEQILKLQTQLSSLQLRIWGKQSYLVTLLVKMKVLELLRVGNAVELSQTPVSANELIV